MLFNPRLWLFVWLGLGAAALLYVILSAALSGKPSKFAAHGAGAAQVSDPNLLVGEMADFVYAASARTVPAQAFFHEDREVTLADFKGETILVNFWATWCAPCLKELPSLDALQRSLEGENFEVVAVAADPTGPDAAKGFLDKLQLRNLKFYADPHLSLAIAAGGSNVLPVSILYDAEGREIGRYVGEADWASPEAENLIRAVIASTAGK